MDCPAGQESLSARVHRTLEDLAAIRQSLLAAPNLAGSSAESSAQILDLELAGQLKSVVDAIRLLLWAYIKALAAQSGRAPAEVLSWYKMELAVEMLRSAAGKTGPTNDGCIASFERLVTETMSEAAKSPVLEHTH